MIKLICNQQWRCVEKIPILRTLTKVKMLGLSGLKYFSDIGSDVVDGLLSLRQH
jgi:hypothetical protein